jgi:hypothetical protein
MLKNPESRSRQLADPQQLHVSADVAPSPNADCWSWRKIFYQIASLLLLRVSTTQTNMIIPSSCARLLLPKVAAAARMPARAFSSSSSSSSSTFDLGAVFQVSFRYHDDHGAALACLVLVWDNPPHTPLLFVLTNRRICSTRLPPPPWKRPRTTCCKCSKPCTRCAGWKSPVYVFSSNCWPWAALC